MQTRPRTNTPEYNTKKQFQFILDSHVLRRKPPLRKTKQPNIKKTKPERKTNSKSKVNPKSKRKSKVVSLSEEIIVKKQKYKIEDSCDEIFDDDGNCICYSCSKKYKAFPEEIEQDKEELTKEIEVSIFEKMLQDDNDMIAKNSFDIESYESIIRDVLSRKQKNKVWDWVQEYINDSNKLDKEFLKTKPRHIFFTKFEKLVFLVEHEFGITPEDVGMVRDPVSIFVYKNNLHKQVVQKSGYPVTKKLDSTEIFFSVVLEIARLYRKSIV